MQRCLQQQLWFISVRHDFELHTHIPGDHNLFAGALSRYHTPSHQAKFARLSKKLGNSYFSHPEILLILMLIDISILLAPFS